MTNHYSFGCPVTGATAGIEHCEKVHLMTMQGRPERIENKLCALAAQCHMCPIRTAFRIGGPWHKPSDRPRRDVAVEEVDKLPAELVNYALSHTRPKASDYRRVGLTGADVGCHDEHFIALHDRYVSKRPERAPTAGSTRAGLKRGTPRPAPEAPAPRNAAEALTDSSGDMAKAVSDLARRERAGEPSAPEPSATPSKTKVARTAPPQEAAAPSTKKMTLVERAKQMREKRSTA